VLKFWLYGVGGTVTLYSLSKILGTDVKQLSVGDIITEATSGSGKEETLPKIVDSGRLIMNRVIYYYLEVKDLPNDGSYLIETNPGAFELNDTLRAAAKKISLGSSAFTKEALQPDLRYFVNPVELDFSFKATGKITLDYNKAALDNDFQFIEGYAPNVHTDEQLISMNNPQDKTWRDLRVVIAGPPVNKLAIPYAITKIGLAYRDPNTNKYNAEVLGGGGDTGSITMYGFNELSVPVATTWLDSSYNRYKTKPMRLEFNLDYPAGEKQRPFVFCTLVRPDGYLIDCYLHLEFVGIGPLTPVEITPISNSVEYYPDADANKTLIGKITSVWRGGNFFGCIAKLPKRILAEQTMTRLMVLAAYPPFVEFKYGVPAVGSVPNSEFFVNLTNYAMPFGIPVGISATFKGNSYVCPIKNGKLSYSGSDFVKVGTAPNNETTFSIGTMFPINASIAGLYMDTGVLVSTNTLRQAVVATPSFSLNHVSTFIVDEVYLVEKQNELE
jgi:hypothetical protein